MEIKSLNSLPPWSLHQFLLLCFFPAGVPSFPQWWLWSEYVIQVTFGYGIYHQNIRQTKTMCMSVFLACVYVYHANVWHQQIIEEGIRYPGIHQEILNHVSFWNWWNFLQYQQFLLTSALNHLSIPRIFFFSMVAWKKTVPKGSDTLGSVALLQEVCHCSGQTLRCPTLKLCMLSVAHCPLWLIYHGVLSDCK